MPLCATLGVRADKYAADEVVLTLDWAPALCTTGGILHGGAIMAVADSAGAACAFLNLPKDATGTATIESKTNFLGAVRAGSVKAIAVAAKRRLPAVPDIPTAEESGLAGFSFSNWVGIFAPKGTPKDIIGKLNSAVASTLADPGIRARLVDLGVEIPTPEQQKPEAFAALQKADVEKWWPIIKAAGIKGE